MNITQFNNYTNHRNETTWWHKWLLLIICYNTKLSIIAVNYVLYLARPNTHTNAIRCHFVISVYP